MSANSLIAELSLMSLTACDFTHLFYNHSITTELFLASWPNHNISDYLTSYMNHTKEATRTVPEQRGLPSYQLIHTIRQIQLYTHIYTHTYIYIYTHIYIYIYIN